MKIEAGFVFGQSVVIGPAAKGKGRYQRFHCRCSCGSERVVSRAVIMKILKRGSPGRCRRCFRNDDATYLNHTADARRRMSDTLQRRSRERIMREGPRWVKAPNKKSNGVYMWWRASIPSSIAEPALEAGVVSPKYCKKTHPESSTYTVMLAEHILEVERQLGRALDPRIEQADHEDGNPSNNDPFNLRLKAKRAHGAGAPVHELHRMIDERDARIAELEQQLRAS